MGASGCLIPFDCDAFARHALYALLDDVAEIPPTITAVEKVPIKHAASLDFDAWGGSEGVARRCRTPGKRSEG